MYWNQKKVLVMGAGIFTGNHLVELEAEGQALVSNTSPERLTRWN